MNKRPVVIRVGELLPAEHAAERALARQRAGREKLRVTAHAREVFETVHATETPQHAQAWRAAMRRLLRLADEPETTAPDPRAAAAFNGGRP